MEGSHASRIPRFEQERDVDSGRLTYKCGNHQDEVGFANKTTCKRSNRKARLVAKGFAQTPGVSYGETFAPVARMSSIRMLMALSVELGMQIQQLDFISAYLNGEITDDVYVEIPKEFEAILSNDDLKKYASVRCMVSNSLEGKGIENLTKSYRAWDYSR